MFFGRRRPEDDDPLAQPPTSWAPELDDWLAAGKRLGYCSDVVCATHDGLPMTLNEELEDDVWDDCQYAVRLWEDGQP